MLNLIWQGLIGLMVGALAKFVMPGKDPGWIFVTIASLIRLLAVIGHPAPGITG